jgi:hypothetical protein
LSVKQRDSQSSRIETPLELGPNEQEKINNEIIMKSECHVEVSFTDTDRASPHSETQQWNDASHPLHIILDDQIVFAVQIR